MIAFLYATLILYDKLHSSNQHSGVARSIQIENHAIEWLESVRIVSVFVSVSTPKNRFSPNYSYVTSKLFYILCPLFWPFSESRLSMCPGWHFFDIQNNFLIFATKWMMTLSNRKLCQSLHLCIHITRTHTQRCDSHFFFYSRDHFALSSFHSFSHFRTLTAGLCLKIMLFMNKMRCNRGN